MENKVNAKMPKKVPPKIKVETTSKVATKYSTLKKSIVKIKYEMAIEEIKPFIEEKNRANELVNDLTNSVFSAQEKFNANKKERESKNNLANEKIVQFNKDLEHINNIISDLEATGDENILQSKAYKDVKKFKDRKEKQIALTEGWNTVRNDKSKTELEELEKLQKDQAAALELQQEANANFEIVNEIVAQEEKEYQAFKERRAERIAKATEQRARAQENNELENAIDSAMNEALESQELNYEELAKDSNESANTASEIFEESEKDANEVQNEKTDSPVSSSSDKKDEKSESKKESSSKATTIVGGIGLMGSAASIALLIAGVINPIVIIILAISALVAGVSFGVALNNSNGNISNKNKKDKKSKQKDNSKDKENTAELTKDAESEKTSEEELEPSVMTLAEEEALLNNQEIAQENVNEDQLENNSYIISNKKISKSASKEILNKFNKEFDIQSNENIEEKTEEVNEVNNELYEYAELNKEFDARLSNIDALKNLKSISDLKHTSYYSEQANNQNIDLKQVKKYLKNIDIEAINDTNQEQYNNTMYSYEAKENLGKAYDEICDMATKLIDKNLELSNDKDKFNDKIEVIETYKSAREDIKSLNEENRAEKIALIQENINNYNKIDNNKALINSTKDKKEKEDLLNSTLEIFEQISKNNKQISEIELMEKDIYESEEKMNDAISNLTSNLLTEYKNSIEKSETINSVEVSEEQTEVNNEPIEEEKVSEQTETIEETLENNEVTEEKPVEETVKASEQKTRILKELTEEEADEISKSLREELAKLDDGISK